MMPDPNEKEPVEIGPVQADTSGMEPVDATVEADAPTTAENATAPALTSQSAKEPRRAARISSTWIVVGVAGLAVVAVAVWLATSGLRSHHGGDGKSHFRAGTESGSDIFVNTVTPRKKLLERTLEQPGTIRPWSQAELYAKVSGYVKDIGLTRPAQQISAPLPEAGSGGASVSVPPLAPGEVLPQATNAAFEFDIGSPVKAGDMLVEIDIPELMQDISECTTFVVQRKAELEEAQSVVATLTATIEATRALQALAAADVERAQSDLTYRSARFNRMEGLVTDRSISADNLDEARHLLATARAALKTSQAKEESAQAELTVNSAKLATAEADIKVKDALVRVAQDKLERAKIVAGYAKLVAPFDGIITSRAVDQGDFVQNASSGQARPLMTVTGLDKVKVVLQVREADAVWVEVGAQASVTVDARSDWHGQGRVSRIGHVLEGQARTMQVEIDLDNRDHRLKPGMYGLVALSLQRIPNAQALPATVLYSRKGSSYIMQVQDGIVRRHLVRLRYDDGKEIEVVKLVDGQEVPLNGTEEIVVSNKGEIADGQRVQTTPLNGG